LSEEIEARRSDVTKFCRCGSAMLPGFRESKDMDVVGLNYAVNVNRSVCWVERADVESANSYIRCRGAWV
jgi:hypothetical protein